jgi:hypothetical protein
MTLGGGTGLFKLTAGVVGLDTSTYLTAEADTLQTVTTRGATTDKAISSSATGTFISGLLDSVGKVSVDTTNRTLDVWSRQLTTHTGGGYSITYYNSYVYIYGGGLNKVDSTGAIVGTLSIASLYHMDVDSNGMIWGVNGSATFYVIDPATMTLAHTYTLLGADKITTGETGYIYAVNSGKFFKVNANTGAITWQVTPSVSVSYLTLDSSGNIWLLGSSKLLKYNTAGTLLGTYSFTASYAIGIASDSSGNIYVGDNTNDVLLKFNNSGTLTNTFTLAGGPYSSAIISGTNILVPINEPGWSYEELSTTGVPIGIYQLPAQYGGRGVVFDGNGHVWVLHESDFYELSQLKSIHTVDYKNGVLTNSVGEDIVDFSGYNPNSSPYYFDVYNGYRLTGSGLGLTGILQNQATGGGVGILSGADGMAQTSINAWGGAGSSDFAITIGAFSTTGAGSTNSVNFNGALNGVDNIAILGSVGDAYTTYTNSISMGKSSYVNGDYGIGIGYGSSTNNYGIAVGYCSSAYGDYGVAVGNGVYAGSNSLALGNNAWVFSSGYSSTIGTFSSSYINSTDYSMILGGYNGSSDEAWLNLGTGGIYDLAGTSALSIDPNNRILYASDGTTPSINWATDTAITFPSYTTAGVLVNDTGGVISSVVPAPDGTYCTGAKLTPVTGTDGSITITNGIITSITAAT